MSNIDKYQHELDDPDTNFQFRIFAEQDLEGKSIAETVNYVGDLWKQLYRSNEVQRQIIQGRWEKNVQKILKEVS